MSDQPPPAKETAAAAEARRLSQDFHTAKLRLLMSPIIFGYVLYVNHWGPGPLDTRQLTLDVLGFLHFMYAVFSFCHFYKSPQPNVPLRVVGTLTDHAGVVLALAITGTNAIVIAWLPLFILTGVALRFGSQLLAASYPVALLDLAVAYYVNPWWMQNVPVAVGVALFTMVIPLYLLPLAKRNERRAELLLIEKRAAERANEAKSAFLATMTHELRSPLMGIVGINEVMAMRQRSVDEMQLLLEQRDAAFLMLSAVNDILDSSKIEAGEMQADSVPFDVDTTVIQILRALSYSARRKSLVLQTQQSSDAPCEIVGSPVYLTRIVQNLVSNAIKFTSAGGVTVRLSRSPRSTATQTWLRLDVEDTGIGIPHAALARIFDRFFQVDASVTRKFGGTGLGTTIVKQFVDLLNGSIEVRSEQGRGSCFTVDLPVEVRSSDGTTSRFKLHHRVGIVIVGASADLFQSFGAACNADEVSLVQASDAVAAWNAKRSLERAGVRHVVFVAEIDESFAETADALAEEIGHAPTWIVIESVGQRGAPTMRASCPRVVGVRREHAGHLDAAALAHAVVAAARVQRIEVLEADGGPNIDEHASKTGRGLRILIAEDTRINQIVFERLLTPRGYELTCAVDGAVALERLAAERYDLAIVDWNMPEVDGLEVVRRTRAGDGPNRDVPIVVATAAVSREVFEGARAAGANEVIGKPFFGRELFAVIERLMPKKPVMVDERDAAVTPTTIEAPFVDFAQLEAPHSLFHGPGVARLIGTFADDARGNLALLEEAVRTQSLVPLRRAIHNLQGFAGVYGAIGLEKLVNAAPNTQEALLEQGPKWIEDMRRTVEATIACLDEWQERRLDIANATLTPHAGLAASERA